MIFVKKEGSALQKRENTLTAAGWSREKPSHGVKTSITFFSGIQRKVILLILH